MMRKFRLALVLTLAASLHLLGSAAACRAEQAAHPTGSLPPELERILTEHEDAWHSGNEKALAALFAEDSWSMNSLFESDQLASRAPRVPTWSGPTDDMSSGSE
jgi:hypothetical protein